MFNDSGIDGEGNTDGIAGQQMSVSIVQQSTFGLKNHLRFVLSPGQFSVRIGFDDLQLHQSPRDDQQWRQCHDCYDEESTGIPDGAPSGRGGMERSVRQRSGDSFR